MARAICREDGQHSLLLGSSKRVCQLTRDDHIKIAAALSLSPTEISAVPTITKKCFLINVGHEGVVLSSKDSIRKEKKRLKVAAIPTVLMMIVVCVLMKYLYPNILLQKS